MDTYKYLGNNRALVSLEGHPFIVDTSSHDLAFPIILKHSWEIELTSFVMSLLPIGGVFVDAGANIGVFSVLGAHKVGSSGRVVAFEPNPRTCGVLKANAVLTAASKSGAATVEVNELALGNKNTSTNLMFMDDMTGGAYISNEAGAMRKEKGWSNVSIQVVKWDDFFGADFKPDVVKLDVEGHEVDLLSGASGFLETQTGFSIFMEACPDMWRGQGHNPVEFLRFLDSKKCGISVVDYHGRIASVSGFESIITLLDDMSRSGNGFGHLLLKK